MTDFRLELILLVLSVGGLVAAFLWRWTGRPWSAIWKWVWVLMEVGHSAVRRKFKRKRGA